MKFGSHPFNLFLRFILEMSVLVAAGIWGWTQHEGLAKPILAISIPIILAVAWGIFAVPDDPSRSGKTVVHTPGWMRLVLESLVFIFGFWAYYASGFHTVSFVFLGLVVVHYILSCDRLLWLMNH